MKDKNGKQKVFDFLLGDHWKPTFLIAEFTGLQEMKWICEIRKEAPQIGYVLEERYPIGKKYKEYRLLKETDALKKKRYDDFMDKANEYPVDHIERKKILDQIKMVA